MCFSAAEERPGRILALPNGFLKTLVAERYGDELGRYAASAGLERIEIVVDPAVSAVAAESTPQRSSHAPPPLPPVPEQRPGLTTRLFAERGFWQLTPLGAGGTRELDDHRGRLRVEAGAQSACGTYEAMVFPGLRAIWGDGHRADRVVECGLRRLSGLLGRFLAALLSPCHLTDHRPHTPSGALAQDGLLATRRAWVRVAGSA
jgi:hypothetical protein